MTTSEDDAAAGRRRAELLIDLVAEGGDAAGTFLAGLADVRELVFVGAGLTALARAEGRRLPPAQRAQASTRQLRLGQLRDAQRGDPDGLRGWLRSAAEEVLVLRSLQAAAEQAVQRERTATTATGSTSTSRPASST